MHREGLLHQSSTLAVIGTNSASSAEQGKDINNGIERIEQSIQSTHSILPVLQRQGKVACLDLHAVRDDVKSINRNMKEHHMALPGSFESLKNHFKTTFSTRESAILARVDDLAQQNLILTRTLERFSESIQVWAAVLVSSGKSQPP